MRVARRISSFFWLALVVAMFCVPLFAGLGRSDLQNDEAIYSYAVDSILETGDWLNPRSSPNPDVVFVEKPPLKFWIVALPIRLGLLPHDEFGLRFWDALFGAVAFLYVFAIGRRMAGPFCGFTAVLVLFSFDLLIFEHGLRTNNMEAALLLAFCGGVYHFLRWAEAEGSRGRTRHAAAVGAYVFFGFMTKFVAVAFLPLILVAATLVVRPARARLVREWRRWAVVSAVVLALAAPWFLYQMTKPGPGIWYVMFGEHVVQRFSSSIDPQHIQPWTFYVAWLRALLTRAGALWIAVAGALLLLVRVCRTRWLDGVVVLTWGTLPLALLSAGTSKLGHYAYPFLPAIAIAGGYVLGTALRAGYALGAGEIPGWVETASHTGTAGRVAAWATRATGAVRTRFNALVTGPPAVSRILRAARLALVALSIVWLGLAAIALVNPRRLDLAGVTVARHPRAAPLAVNALIVAALAGRGAAVLRVALPIILLTLAPLRAYRAALPRLMEERHPMRSAAACILEVRNEELRAGRPVREMIVSLDEADFLHPQFYYLRRAGWDVRNGTTPGDFEALVDVAGAPGPALISRARFERHWLSAERGARSDVPRVAFSHVLLLTPGPFSRCRTE